MKSRGNPGKQNSSQASVIQHPSSSIRHQASDIKHPSSNIRHPATTPMTPSEIVNSMMAKDQFSQWLGIEIKEVREAYCRLEMRIREEMLNGFSIAHGGIAYSFADSALAFASNSKGRQSLSVETSIAHIHSLKDSDRIEAIAEMDAESDKYGYYLVKIIRMPEEEVVALFRGMVYKTSRNW
jgi:acyl-CoA thioesterase